MNNELEAINKKIKLIATKTDKLKYPNVDMDLLDEQARDILGLIREDEIILVK